MEKLFIKDKFEYLLNDKIIFIKSDDEALKKLININVEETGLFFQHDDKEIVFDSSIRLDIRLCDFGILHCYFISENLDKNKLFESVKALKTKDNDYYNSLNKLLKTFDTVKAFNPFLLAFENSYNVDILENVITDSYNLDCPLLFEAHPRPIEQKKKIEEVVIKENKDTVEQDSNKKKNNNEKSKFTIRLSEETKDVLIDYAILAISSILTSVSLVGTIIFLLTNNAMSVLFIILSIVSSIFTAYIIESTIFRKNSIIKWILLFLIPIAFVFGGMGIAYAIFMSKIPEGTSIYLVTLLPVGIAFAFDILMTIAVHLFKYLKNKYSKN